MLVVRQPSLSTLERFLPIFFPPPLSHHGDTLSRAPTDYQGTTPIAFNMAEGTVSDSLTGNCHTLVPLTEVPPSIHSIDSSTAVAPQLKVVGDTCCTGSQANTQTVCSNTDQLPQQEERFTQPPQLGVTLNQPLQMEEEWVSKSPQLEETLSTTSQLELGASSQLENELHQPSQPLPPESPQLEERSSFSQPLQLKDHPPHMKEKSTVFSQPLQLGKVLRQPPQVEKVLCQPLQLGKVLRQPPQVEKVLCQPLQMEEREQLGQESDGELDIPAAEVPPSSPSNSSETNYQGPPRKIARLEEEEHWEGESAAEVPPSHLFSPDNSPETDYQGPPRKIARLEEEEDWEGESAAEVPPSHLFSPDNSPETDYQGPPRKIARLEEEEDWEGESAAEVPPSHLFSPDNSPVTDYQEPPRKIARLEEEEDWEGEPADDGSSTVDQAVPGSQECAQGHTSPPSLSPCRQRRGGGGGEGGGRGDLVQVCDNQQVVPCDSGDREETSQLPSLYGHEPLKLHKTSFSWEEDNEDEEEPSSLRHHHHHHSCYSCGRRQDYSSVDTYPTTVRLNLSRPRLRVGLSKCQRLTSLHSSLNTSREE